MIGGLVTSAFLTLEVIPVLYTIWRTRQLARRAHPRQRRRTGDAPRPRPDWTNDEEAGQLGLTLGPGQEAVKVRDHVRLAGPVRLARHPPPVLVDGRSRATERLRDLLVVVAHEVKLEHLLLPATERSQRAIAIERLAERGSGGLPDRSRRLHSLPIAAPTWRGLAAAPACTARRAPSAATASADRNVPAAAAAPNGSSPTRRQPSPSAAPPRRTRPQADPA